MSSSQFIAHRTETKFVSFSWKNRMMGLVVPIGQGHDDNPFVTVPITSGFVGSFVLAPKRPARPKTVEHVWSQTPDGFETTGSLLLNGGLLKQTIRVTSIGKATVVYQDRVTALADVSLSRELGVPVGIENDEVTGGQRVVYYQGGMTMFDWKTPRKACRSARFVGQREGPPRRGDGGSAPAWATNRPPAMIRTLAVCPDILYGSFSDRPRRYQAGQQVAQRIVLFFVEVTPKTTSTMSRSFSIAEKSGAQVLHFNLPEGGQADVPLLSAGQ